MDLRTISFPLRDTEGERYARMLVAVLDRCQAFRPDDLPDRPQSTYYSIPVNDAETSAAGYIELARQENGAWLFSTNTVEQLPALWERTRTLPKVWSFGPVDESKLMPSNALRSRVPQQLRADFFFLELWQWAAIGILAVLAMVVATIARGLVRAALRVFFRRSDERLGTESKKSLRRASGLLAGTALWWAVAPSIGLPALVFAFLAFILKLLWAIGFAWLLVAAFDVVLDLTGAKASALVHRADHILIPVARKFGKFVIYVAVALAFAASLDVNVAGLVTGLGIGGLVVALAAKDSVENIFGSLTILFDMPFGIGDWIKIGDVTGSVEEINLRSTRIRTAPDTVITLPNSNLIKVSVENFSVRRFRRFNFTVGLSYTNPLAKVENFVSLVRQTVVGNSKVRADDALVQINTLADNSMGVLVQGFFLTDSYMEEMSLTEAMISQILKDAEKSGVVLGTVSWMPPAMAER
jgi:MscS family membrane protein